MMNRTLNSLYNTSHNWVMVHDYSGVEHTLCHGLVLLGRLSVIQGEWDKFNIKLRLDSFIQSGTLYFQPDVKVDVPVNHRQRGAGVIIKPLAFPKLLTC